MLQNPRWEGKDKQSEIEYVETKPKNLCGFLLVPALDYNYDYCNNRFAYLGNGFTLREVEERDMVSPNVMETKKR